MVGTSEMVHTTPMPFPRSRQNPCEVSKPVFLAWDLLVFLILSCIPENRLGVQGSFVGRSRRQRPSLPRPISDLGAGVQIPDLAMPLDEPSAVKPNTGAWVPAKMWTESAFAE